MDLLIILIFVIFIWRGLGLHRNHYYPRMESKRERKFRLQKEEREKLSMVKKYYVHDCGDRIEAIREDLFNENTFTIISINDELFVVGHTIMMPCKDIWEAEKLQYRNLIEYSYNR